ncbi:AaceriAFR600Cp [[Ashbya] aceris (nom. inval.)]|nr:AaceriAFR600Cp [[Ashbya] aceris (nom. inval.)]
MSAGSAVSATQIYSAKYSGVEVYEFLHPTGSIMKRKVDDWVNATHILKAAKFAKAKRTRILEKEVIKDTHEKVQGGFGKYQGTWVPLDIARRLAQKFEVLEELRPLFDFTRRDGSESPPQAPKHHHASRSDSARKRTTKSPPLPHGQLDNLPKRRGRPPRARKLSDVANAGGQAPVYSDFPRPAIPVSSISSNQLPSLQSTLQRSISIEHNRNKGPPQMPHHKYEELDIEDGLSSDIETNIGANMVYAGHSNTRLPMNTSLLPDKEEPGLSSSLPSSPSEFSAPMVFDTQRVGSATSPLGSMLPRYMALSRPRTSELDQKTNEYLSKLVDYFINCEVQNSGTVPVELLHPPHSSPCIDSWIDSEHHTAFHWACAMGNLPIVEALLQAGASPRALNQAGETPLMRASLFHNSYTKRTYPRIFQLLQDTVFDVDSRSQTVVHHIVKRKSNTQSALYYLDVLLSKLKDFSPQYRIETLINAQDYKGNTPLHIAAINRDKKFFQTLVGNGALSTIKNHDGVTADELINNRFVKTIQPTQRGNYHENGASHSPLNSAGAAGMVPASLIHTGDMYPSQSATSVSRAIPEVINLMKDMADSYQYLYEDRNQEVQDVIKMLKSMSATVTSLDMKVLEILEVKDMNNIAYEMDSLKANIARLKETLSEKQKVLVSLLEKSQRIMLTKAVEEEKEASESVVATPADDGTYSNKEALAADLRELTVLQLRRKLRMNRLIEMLCGNSKIHKFRKMISQGTDMDIGEVDNFLDIIFQQLNEDEENANNGGHNTTYNGHVSCAILDTGEGYGIESIENKRGTSRNEGPAK